MLYQLKRHPVDIDADLEHVLVLTYALPADVLRPLVPPGLKLETLRGFGIAAVALVQARHLRPRGLPACVGRDFFLCGQRIFTTHRDAAGVTRRGLRIVRSLTDRPMMATFGNLLTHYNYQRVDAAMDVTDERISVDVRGALSMSADLRGEGSLPPDSIFRDEHEARRFAGPLPYTFDYEPQTHSIIMIKGERSGWRPRLVNAAVTRNTLFDTLDAEPVLCSAFYLSGAPYRWRRGVRHALAERN